MVGNLSTVPSIESIPVTTRQHKSKLTVFHCSNAFNIVGSDAGNYAVHSIQMPCSSMTREVFILRAFEAGADAVLIIVCPVGTCRYIEGNIRAGKRVARMKNLLDEIGLDGRRLNIHFIQQGDQSSLNLAVNQTLDFLATLEQHLHSQI